MSVMPALLRVYPDACFIWPHRDPVRALASAMNFMGTAHWGRSDFPLKDASFDEVLEPPVEDPPVEVLEPPVDECE